MADEKRDIFRDISVKLLFKAFWNSGLTANQITILNFVFLYFPSVILFALGYELIGLLVAGIGAMVDYIDGTVARYGRGSPNGQFLDTSSDWLFLMMLIGAISYYHQIMPLGYLTLIFLTWGNWVQYNGNVNIKLPKYLTCTLILTLSIILRHAELGITGIMFVQGIRTGLLYWRAVWEKLKG